MEYVPNRKLPDCEVPSHSNIPEYKNPESNFEDHNNIPDYNPKCNIPMYKKYIMDFYAGYIV